MSSSVMAGGLAEIYVMKKLHKDKMRQMKMAELAKEDLEHEYDDEEKTAVCCLPFLKHRVHPRTSNTSSSLFDGKRWKEKDLGSILYM